MYPTLEKLNWPEIEQEILAFWDEHDIFKQSISNRENDPSFTFYEGPPSANGMPGIHHVMARAMKDIFCRFKTLNGYKVNRKGGWDTHGLPIELQVEKRLGIKKEDIGVKISVEDYNKECREDVLKFKDKWDDLTKRIGFWLDLDNPYITYENEYIETVWYLLKMLHEKGYLYKGYTIQPYSPAAGTGLSSHELNQPGTYQNVKDTTIVAQFKKKGTENEFFLAWTTTPWTLPSNTGLAVGKKIDYVDIETFNQYTGERIIVTLADLLKSKYFPENTKDLPFEEYQIGQKTIPWRILNLKKGSDLVGLEYEQLLPYVQPTEGKSFIVVAADFVSTEDGTGIVHLAPSFGSDDFKTAKENGLAQLTLVDKRGKFLETVTDFANEYVKEAYLSDEEKQLWIKQNNKDKYLSVDERISIKLKTENRAFKVEKYEHSYPHCWRTDKPILYYPLESWFIKTTAVKDRLIELNKTINWKPQSTGEGRFGNWLENLVDWNLSRSRYWGTPLPIWRSEDGTEELCIGSIEELSKEVEKANTALGLNQSLDNLDLHRPFVDSIVLVGSQNQPLKRELDLIDVWFDSGAMPYAQWHWPFENKEIFDQNYPADFIAEGVDQTRGWFFTLHAISTLLFDNIAFKNVIANGLVLDKNGNKMSKRLGNAIDPIEVIDKYGVDALRWYMCTNSQPWDNLKFDIDGVVEAQRKFLGTLYNTYGFFAIYANLDNYQFVKGEDISKNPNLTELDSWILSKLNTLVKEVKAALNDYDPTKAARYIEEFVGEELSNWFVRLSRRRFWKGEMNDEKKVAYDTLYTCLNTVSIIISPIAPFFADWLYKSLNYAEISNNKAAISVHLTDWPSENTDLINELIENQMKRAQTVCSLVLSLRKKEKIRVRQPLQKIIIPVLTETMKDELKMVEHIILSEVNVKEIEYLSSDHNLIVKKVKPNFKVLGKKLGPHMKTVAEKITEFTQDHIQRLENNELIDILDLPIEFSLALEDVEITAQDMPGWLVSNQGDTTVALDITISEILQKEGIARELINRIQNLRKSQDFDITDIISIHYNSGEEIINTINEFNSYICQEVLASEILLDTSMNLNETEVYEKPIFLHLIKK